MKLSAEVTGVKEIDKMLTQIAPNQAKNIMRSTVHGIAGELAKESRKIAPDDPFTKAGVLLALSGIWHNENERTAHIW